jgi:hypothetical protein
VINQKRAIACLQICLLASSIGIAFSASAKPVHKPVSLPKVESVKTQLKLDTPAVFAGRGCPTTGADAAMIGNSIALKLRKGSFVTEAKAKRTTFANCTLTVGVTVPGGNVLQLDSIDIGGKVSAPKGGVAELSYTSQVAGKSSMLDKLSFKNYSGNITKSTKLGVPIVNACSGAQTTVLSLGITTIAKSSDAKSPVKLELLTPISKAEPAGLKLNMSLKPCK